MLSKQFIKPVSEELKQVLYFSALAEHLNESAQIEHLERCLLSDKVWDPSGLISVERPSEYDPLLIEV